MRPVSEQTVDADWICVTDRNPAEFDGTGWRAIYEPRNHMHPRLAAKVAKCQPERYSDAEISVWMDGSCRLLLPDSLEQIIDGAAGADIAQVVHPWRSCIFDEAQASAGMPKYEGQSVLDQVEHYRSEGHSEKWGLWATGLIVRRSGTAPHLGVQWLLEQIRWTYQDQLSQPYVLRNLGIRPYALPFALHGSGVFEWLNHVSDL